MKASRSLASIFFSLALGILLSSCCLFIVNTYNVGFRNIGTRNLFVTSGIIGNYAPPVGVLPPSKSGLAMSTSHSGIPESVKIKWKKDNGEVVEREVKVKENLPARFGGNDTIVFNINDNDEIILSFQRWGDKEIDSKGNEVKFNNY